MPIIQEDPSHSHCVHLNYDVLREIFIHCICDAENRSTCFVLDARKRSQTLRELPQLSVSRVCSQWRHTALLTPQLWNNIKFVDVTEGNLSIAREYLSRAETIPISLSFGLCGMAEQDLRPQLTEFLSSFRIRFLTISPNMPSFHLILPDLPPRSVADLESLLMSNKSDEEEASIDLNDIQYPKLAMVRIWGTAKISGVNSHLRIFDGTRLSMTVIESWDLLRHFPSLEEARVRLTGPVYGGIWPVVQEIKPQHLRILSLHSESDGIQIPFRAFIEALSLPVIEELHVFHARLAWSSTAFQSLARRSNHFPHLRDLVLRNTTFIVNAGTLLASIPSVKSISVCSGFAASSVVFDLTTLNDLANGILAPRLHSLIVGSISNARSFLDMVELRMKNSQMSSNGVPAPFTRVMFAPDQGYDNNCKQLLAMRQRGIPINSWKYHV